MMLSCGYFYRWSDLFQGLEGAGFYTLHGRIDNPTLMRANGAEDGKQASHIAVRNEFFTMAWEGSPGARSACNVRLAL
jgi:hypothetical protein